VKSRKREVVVEAVVDHRADRHLRLGKQLFHCVGEQVRRRVAAPRPSASRSVTIATSASRSTETTCRPACRRPARRAASPGRGQWQRPRQRRHRRVKRPL
jgi:hypothetical protein